MLEQKLATLQRLLASTQEASESSWQVGDALTHTLTHSHTHTHRYSIFIYIYIYERTSTQRE